MRSMTVAVRLAVLAMTLTAAAARAEDPPPKPFKITADAAYVNTAGNSDVQTLTGNEKVEYKKERWTLTQDAAAVWGTDNGVENAGRYYVGLRLDYTIVPRLSTFGFGSWRRNSFAGISRQFDEGLGLTYHALKPNPHLLDLEAGVGLSQRYETMDTSDDFSTGRFGALYQYYFREKTYFEVHGIYQANFEASSDYEYDMQSALVAPLSGILALKLNYNYHYRNEPPADVKTWDSTFAAGLQITY